MKKEQAVLSPQSNGRSIPELLELDRKHVWHPYAAMPNPVPSVLVDSADGVYLNVRTTDDEQHSRRRLLQLVDGMSSWWACIHGYNHPVLNAAIAAQLSKMSHVMFGGLTHEPAIELATKLVELTNSNNGNIIDTSNTDSALQHVFFCDSGSVAVEVAMKMAQQYWYNLDCPGKNRFLTVKSGYHGDTFQAMSVCDPVTGMHHLFQTVLRQQLFADQPSPAFGQPFDESHMTSMKQLLEQHHNEIAAVILEPIVQGAGGMRFYAAEYLQRVRHLCNDYNVLLIADEIATGFGRTGQHLFACQHAGITPDIMCLGKAITGGYMSLAATLTTPKVAQLFGTGESGVLMHGPTFMGNPLACAVSLASIRLLLEENNSTSDWRQAVSTIETQLRTELEPCRESEFVQDVRVLGAIGVVELKQAVNMKTIQPAILNEGVWLRPFGKLLYTMPPYIIEPHQLRKITRAMVNLTRRRF